MPRDTVRDLWQVSNSKITACKRSNELVEENTASRQDGAASKLAAKKSKKISRGYSGATCSIDSYTIKTPREANHTFLKPTQASIDSSIEKMAQTDIKTCHPRRTREMAIADFLHCHNIPDIVAGSSLLKRIVDLARQSSKDFKVPGRKKVGGAPTFELRELQRDHQDLPTEACRGLWTLLA
jgi:hypothetical protein